ncbi:ANTH domain-containing protein [Desarmillaria tabescens]|uniref:ANTH domain-containing protein n=1 Tax=Armillaria tabescens TaxID=1929756 RepID=A0AA39NKJ3_ARMTA|nr:ANTH domain-containing protein [Desarmillaria tabescens]KAK0467183.1 ANTH domain-containing protein [Desarmillaria tabescens]
MSSYDKVVKLACKPKAAPPKAKYLDPIIAATWSEDGAVHDVCKALSPRFREPNAIVVFKALIVLHTMIRNGATDNVLSYLSSTEVLRLSNVSAGNWEGYAAPENLQNYAVYLESRIRAYRDLKHDAVRVQAESNRDMRNSQSIEEDGYRGNSKRGKSAQSAAPSRSKTIMGRKLRSMTVEKGLLRETRAVHRMIDALVECRFYLDDLEDELTITALRMLVKDLLILFQAGNEGVINVLEHYFEMSHVDAEEALSLYRHFCQQTEKVVEYLGVAKKLLNLLNVPVPNLKHAPVSLAGALQEYLDDPNFEQNRIEYKTNKELAERGSKGGPTPKKPETASSSTLPTKTSSPPSTSNKSMANNAQTGSTNGPVIDFFSAIEEEAPQMFNAQANSPNANQYQQQGTVNPFVLRQMTGQPFMQAPQQMQLQPTGFPMGGPAPNPFGLSAPTPRLQLQPTGHRPFSTFLPQPTGQPQLSPQVQQPQGFLQPQPTGANPFRQSMLLPQTTGMALFGVGGSGGLQPQQTSAFMNANPIMNAPNQNQGQGAFGLPSTNPQSFSASSSFVSPAPQTSAFQGHANVPARPASTPLTSFGPSSSSSSTSPPAAQPIKTHQTGTRNPFGRVATPPPPVPKQPTLMELAMGMHLNGNATNQAQSQSNPSSPPAQSQPNGQSNFSFGNSSLNPGATDISGVASSFAFKPSGSDGKPASSSNFLNSQNTSTTSAGSTFSDTLWSSLSSQPTGATNASSSPSISLTPSLKSQPTGFPGLKPFKPSSSFGASLLESLPPIPQSAPTTPAVTGNGTSANLPSGSPASQQTGAFPFNTQSAGSLPGSQNQNNLNPGTQPLGMGALNSQPTGAFSALGQPRSTLGVGLRPQMTGSVANPFRASSVNGLTTGGASLFQAPTSGLGGAG